MTKFIAQPFFMHREMRRKQNAMFTAKPNRYRLRFFLGRLNVFVSQSRWFSNNSCDLFIRSVESIHLKTTSQVVIYTKPLRTVERLLKLCLVLHNLWKSSSRIWCRIFWCHYVHIFLRFSVKTYFVFVIVVLKILLIVGLSTLQTHSITLFSFANHTQIFLIIYF